MTAFDLDSFIDDGHGNYVEPEEFKARVSSMSSEDIRAFLTTIDDNKEALRRRQQPTQMRLPRSAPLPFRVSDVLLSAWTGCQVALAGLREADETAFERGRDAFVRTRLEETYAELDKLVSKLNFGEPQTSVCLSAEEIWEAQCQDLCICMKVQGDKIYCVTATGDIVTKSKSDFAANAKTAPDFNRIGITDGGQTLVFGDYEAEFFV